MVWAEEEKLEDCQNTVSKPMQRVFCGEAWSEWQIGPGKRGGLRLQGQEAQPMGDSEAWAAVRMREGSAALM